MTDDDSRCPADAWWAGHLDGYYGQACRPPLAAGADDDRDYRLGFLAGGRDRRREAAEVRRLRFQWAGVSDDAIPF